MAKGLKGFQKGHKIGVGNKHTLGKNPPNKGQRNGKVLSCLYCGKEVYKIPSWKGEKSYCSRECSFKFHRGENVYNYKNGKSTSKKHDWIRKNSKKFKDWRKFILKRDGNKCKKCGSKDKLEIHHIIPFSLYPELVVLKMNGVVLCHKCHKDTDSYGVTYSKNKSIGKSISLFFTVPHIFQAYPTVGNYEWTEDGILVIFVSEMNNDDYHNLVFLHEFIEANLCKKKGITDEEITKFDVQYEIAREQGTKSICGCMPTKDSEPGFDKHACYNKEHEFATLIEQQVAAKLNVDWNEYDKTVENL